MKEEEFEEILNRAAERLRRDIQEKEIYRAPIAFEERVREVLREFL